MPTTNWIWLRHAKAAPSAGFCGRLDVDVVPFTAVLSEFLSASRPDVLLVSPLRRARSTAAVLFGSLGMTQRLCEGLAEQAFGEWEGQGYEIAQGLMPEGLEGMAAFRPPGGESFADVVARVRGVMRDIEAEHAGRNLCLVAHAGVIRAALAVALGIPAARALGFAVDHLSATAMTSFGGQGWRVDYVNRPACRP